MVEQVDETRGQAAERRVHDALKVALPADWHSFPDPRHDQLDVIAPPELARRLARMTA